LAKPLPVELPEVLEELVCDTSVSEFLRRETLRERLSSVTPNKIARNAMRQRENEGFKL